MPWLTISGAVSAALLVLGIFAGVFYRLTDYGSVPVELSVAGAAVEVRLDGAPTSLADGVLRLRPGDHHIEVISADYDTVYQAFAVHRGRNEPLHVPLEPKYGSATIVLSDPSARVEIQIDGKPGYHPGDVVPHLWSRREHHLDVTGDGYEPLHETFRVPACANRLLSVSLQPKRTGPVPSHRR